MSKHTITIKTDNRVPLRFWALKMAYLAAMQLLVIGVGIWAQSPAMQWAGLAFLVSFILAAAVGLAEIAKQRTSLTIAEARAMLDRIEAGE